jgi:hypothetical protein
MNDQLKGEHVLVFVDEGDGGNLGLDKVPTNESYIELLRWGTPESSFKGLTIVDPDTLQV